LKLFGLSNGNLWRIVNKLSTQAVLYNTVHHLTQRFLFHILANLWISIFKKLIIVSVFVNPLNCKSGGLSSKVACLKVMIMIGELMTAKTASIIMAAGRGTRMKGFQGNKTLLPLVPEASAYKGRRSILTHIIESLPPGPKAVIVHHKKEAVIDETRRLDIVYCDQPVLNGTGGALLAARTFIEDMGCDRLIITMGDVPLVRRETYVELAGDLGDNSMVVLGFVPKDKKKYGLLDIKDGYVRRIIEWKYWKTIPEPELSFLSICNSGVYAARKKEILAYLSVLESRPQIVKKEISGKIVDVEEFFLTDLVEYMVHDNLSIGCVIAEDPAEMIGVDDEIALKKAQALYNDRFPEVV
jgi:bifunctional UDP-N-acetylglucosamine pyrophosphorylase / glucosamine-1-phosphate N-acetyltransferase